ncbi:MAG TPA: GDSL-type esterase/lipase family protein [Pseudomonadales bacterium]|nr:GDSL-type esterase/lipase family protein [Pseudomonadales bacterium]
MSVRSLVLLLPLVLAGACGGPPPLTPLDDDAVILAFGDSLTHGTGAAAGDAYPEALAELTGLRVVNDGVPGEVTRLGLARLPASLAAHRPDLVVLVHGGNDILRRQSGRAAADNLARMIDLIRADGAQVVMLAVPGPSLTLAPPAWYEEVAKAHGVPMDDGILSSLMRDASMKSDQVHFNRAGYRRMAEAVLALLRDAGALK